MIPRPSIGVDNDSIPAEPSQQRRARNHSRAQTSCSIHDWPQGGDAFAMGGPGRRGRRAPLGCKGEGTASPPTRGSRGDTGQGMVVPPADSTRRRSEPPRRGTASPPLRRRWDRELNDPLVYRREIPTRGKNPVSAAPLGRVPPCARGTHPLE